MFDEILQWFSSHLSNLTDALVYCAIAGVTLIGVFKCLIPLITTTHALRRAITACSRMPARGRAPPSGRKNALWAIG